MKKFFLFFFVFVFAPAVFPQQDINIVEYLKEIEKGNADQVRDLLPELKSEHPGAPSLIYLEGLLTEDGTAANKLYVSLVDNYPKSSYADAALFRLYSYHTALNQTDISKKYYDRLIREYPSSPYAKILPLKETKVETEVYKYSIQAGAFSSNSNAENLRRKFIKAGYHTVVKDKNVGGTVFKIVYTGRFKTRSEAENFQVILNKEYGLKGIITQYQE